MFETKEQRDAFYKSQAWVKKRQEILERDHWECQRCARNGLLTSREEKLVVHHILELKDYPELRLDDDNLETLCFNCHEIMHDRAFIGNSHRRFNKWSDDEWW